ncbi:MAG: ATP-binding protein [Candidatus Aminicenantes bacterium]|nr:ATP-binding protein [Candidatus Aminicenantes bacterium]
MISKILLKNFVLFKLFKWDKINNLNVIIGENDTGKTNLLKLLYSTSRAWSIYSSDKKNNKEKPFNETLTDKIFDTFQPRANGIGDLVSIKSRDKLEAEIVYFADTNNRQQIQFRFSRKSKKITDTNEFIEPCKDENFNSIFIPPKEVLTAFEAILSTRSEEKWMYGFDDTYKDLIDLLLIDTIQGKQKANLPSVVSSLEALMKGRISQSRGKEKFIFSRKGNEKYSMSMTAEGIKRLGIYITLINNRQLHPGSILFLDEPEAELHPKAIRVLADMIFNFSKAGIQVFVSTHNYFLLKQLELNARKEKTEVQCCSLKNADGLVTADFSDLQNGMPDNPIVDVALDIFDEDIAID